MKFNIAIFLFTLVASVNISQAQTFADKRKSLQEIFDNVVNAYGNAKSEPHLELRPKGKQKIIARYITTPQPAIEIDEELVDVCKSFGRDSSNALAIIISHELAHYYNDHTFCSDYAFAIRETQLGQTLKAIDKTTQVEKETIADGHGLFYSLCAGYQPLSIFDKLLDKIYQHYKLPSAPKGYPSLAERKQSIKFHRNDIEKKYPVFEAGILLLYLNKFDEAEVCFDYLSKFFPSREIYNNWGVAIFLRALSRKPYEPINFIYPTDIDPLSRIYQSGTRGSANDNTPYVSALKEAKRKFEKANSLDPSYIRTYINLACINDALGNFQMALGNIYEGEQLKNEYPKLQHIKAIVKYHADFDKMAAKGLFRTLSNLDSLAAYNFRLLKIAEATNFDIISLDNFKESWIEKAMNKKSDSRGCDASLNANLNANSQISKLSDQISIKSKITNKTVRLVIILAGKTIDAQVSFDNGIGGQSFDRDIIIANANHGCLTFPGSLSKMISYSVK